MTKIDIQYQDQFGRWRHLQTKHNEGRIALPLTAHDRPGNAIDWWIKTETFWT